MFLKINQILGGKQNDKSQIALGDVFNAFNSFGSFGSFGCLLMHFPVDVNVDYISVWAGCCIDMS